MTDSNAKYVAAKITGKLPVIVAVGRPDPIGRFVPFGQVEAVADVFMGEDGWRLAIQNVKVPYLHESPRIITHVGVFTPDGWLLDDLPKTEQFLGEVGRVFTMSIEHPLPEIFDDPGAETGEESSDVEQ